MAPHTYTITITKGDDIVVITERSVSKLFLKVREHVELPEKMSVESFRNKYVRGNSKHESFKVEVSDREHIPASESKKTYKKKRAQESKLERKEVIVLRKQVEEQNRIILELQVQIATLSQGSYSDDTEE